MSNGPKYSFSFRILELKEHLKQCFVVFGNTCLVVLTKHNLRKQEHFNLYKKPNAYNPRSTIQHKVQ